jgi:two-component system alkaline phosphatase synthesis response regulator PhoP
MATRQKILVVDDDPQIVTLLRSYLEAALYDVLTAYDGETALHILRRERPGMLLLDLMLPERDGWELTRLIRADRQLRKMPIIFITARVEDTDKIVGLELGADDYITKPFNPREVMARVRSVLRRSELTHDDTDARPVLRAGTLTLDTGTREVRRSGQPIKLTPTEFKLLHTLMQHPNMVFTRAELAERAFGYDYDLVDRALDNHISNLRKKLEDDPQDPQFVITIYGVGYKLIDE